MLVHWVTPAKSESCVTRIEISGLNQLPLTLIVMVALLWTLYHAYACVTKGLAGIVQDEDKGSKLRRCCRHTKVGSILLV